MQQTSTAWDPRYIDTQIPASTRAFMLYLLVVFIVASVKLVKVWLPAAPFRLSARMNTPLYAELLNNSSTSLKRWMELTLLLWGIFASFGLYDACTGLLHTRVLGTAIVFVFQDMSKNLEMTLLVVLFLFLSRWHILRRVEVLRRMSGESR